jgi:hypothetical protein
VFEGKDLKTKGAGKGPEKSEKGPEKSEKNPNMM